MSRLLLMTAGATTPVVDPPLPAAIPANVNIGFDGNSITWYGMKDQVIEAFALHGADSAQSATWGSVALGGLSWSDLVARHENVDGMWRPSASHNVLVVAEDTNGVFADRSPSQIIDLTRTYIDTVRAAHPWRIVLWGNVPQGYGNAGTHPEDVSRNATLIAVNAFWRDNWQAEGLDAWVDVRAPIPQFNHNGSRAAYFQAYPDDWIETVGPWIHPDLGSFERNTGRRAIARRIRNHLLWLDW